METDAFEVDQNNPSKIGLGLVADRISAVHRACLFLVAAKWDSDENSEVDPEQSRARIARTI